MKKKIFKISQMSQKNGKDILWAIIDEYGHTMVQIWSEKEPIEYVKDLGGEVEDNIKVLTIKPIKVTV